MQNLLPPEAAVIAERNKDLFSFLISFSFKLYILGGVCFVLKICNKRVKSVREKKTTTSLKKKKRLFFVFPCFIVFQLNSCELFLHALIVVFTVIVFTTRSPLGCFFQVYVQW